MGFKAILAIAITTLAIGPCAVLLRTVQEAVRTGRCWARHSLHDRDIEPLRYWLSLGGQSLLLALMVIGCCLLLASAILGS